VQRVDHQFHADSRHHQDGERGHGERHIAAPRHGLALEEWPALAVVTADEKPASMLPVFLSEAVGAAYDGKFHIGEGAFANGHAEKVGWFAGSRNVRSWGQIPMTSTALTSARLGMDAPTGPGLCAWTLRPADACGRKLPHPGT
jgi:hypothetical protein